MATKNTKKSTSVASTKVLVKSKSQNAIEETIAKLEAKKASEGLNVSELQRLANARLKIEDRSASKLYKMMVADFEAGHKDIIELLGNSKFPSFKDFVSKLPNKLLFSKWDALGVLAKCNRSAQIKTKVDKQGGVSGEKAEKVTIARSTAVAN